MARMSLALGVACASSLFLGCAPSSPPVRVAADGEEQHNYRVAERGGWRLETWMEGSILHPIHSGEVAFVLTPLNSEPDALPETTTKVEVVLVLKDKAEPDRVFKFVPTFTRVVGERACWRANIENIFWARHCVSGPPIVRVGDYTCNFIVRLSDGTLLCPEAAPVIVQLTH